MSTTSRRAIQRRAQEIAEQQASEPVLPALLEAAVSSYRPMNCTKAEWDQARPVFCTVMRRSGIRGQASMKKHTAAVAQYLLYRVRSGLDLSIEATFSATQIDAYYVRGMTGKSARTRNDYRSRILGVARTATTGADAPVKAPALGHRSVRPGYSRTEEVQIRRVAMRQRSALRRRQMCAIVALTMGAGLAPTDLRQLTVGAITDHGEGGIEITMRSDDGTRTAWVRRVYEPLMRIGIEGLRPAQLVIGEKVDRRNITTGILDRVDAFDGPELDASRMRSTWLTWALCGPVPIQLIMATAGLKTARSLTELVADLDDTDLAVRASTTLRGDDR